MSRYENAGLLHMLPEEPDLVDRETASEQVGSFVQQALSNERPVKISLTGPPGVGKTTLAVRLAYDYIAKFPDGRFYIELGGSTPGGQISASEVLAQFLRGLGQPDEGIPPTEAERRTLFRTLTYGMRIVMVLDDAFSADQVLKVLPSSPHALVVVTSRRRHSKLLSDGFTEVEVEPFTAKASAQLLRQRIDEELLSAEPDAVDALISVCDGLPLALVVAAAKIVHRRRRPVSAFLDTVNRRTSLESFELDGDGSMNVLLDTSYQDLSDAQSQAYALLSLHPGPHFSVAAAAAMLDVSVPEAQDLLDDLFDVCLIQQKPHDRYRFHNMIALHARARALADQTARCGAAVSGAVTYYRRRAVALSKVVSRRWWVGGDDTQTINPAYEGPDAGEMANAELVIEQLNLRAAVFDAEHAGLYKECAELCQALRPWLYDTDRTADLIEITKAGLRSAKATGNRALLMRLHHDLGSALEKAGEFDQAIEQFEHSEALARELGSNIGLASAIEWQGLVREQQSDVVSALARLREAWQIRESTPEEAAHIPEIDADESFHRPRSLALLGLHIGRNLVAAGNADEAIEPLLEARQYFVEHDEPPINIGRASQTLGEAYLALGRHGEAIVLLEQAQANYRHANAGWLELAALRSLAGLHRGLGDSDAARACLEQARELAERQGRIGVRDQLEQELTETE